MSPGKGMEGGDVENGIISSYPLGPHENKHSCQSVGEKRGMSGQQKWLGQGVGKTAGHEILFKLWGQLS